MLIRCFQTKQFLRLIERTYPQGISPRTTPSRAFFCFHLHRQWKRWSGVSWPAVGICSLFEYECASCPLHCSCVAVKRHGVTSWLSLGILWVCTKMAPYLFNILGQKWPSLYALFHSILGIWYYQTWVMSTFWLPDLNEFIAIYCCHGSMWIKWNGEK